VIEIILMINSIKKLLFREAIVKTRMGFEQKIRKIIRNLLVMSCLMFTVIGCATFQSTKKYDISPFATSMIAVAGDIQYSLLQYQVIAVRKYTGGPAVKDFQAHKNKLRKLIQGIIAYSIEVVTLSESNMSDSERANALADYLESLEQPTLEKPLPKLNITQSQLDTIIANVRSQKIFLDALGAAQPLIDEVGRISRVLTEETKISLDSAYVEVLEKWEKEYAGTIWAKQIIKDAQMNAITALYYGNQFVRGNKSSIDSIYKYDPFIGRMYPETKNLTNSEIIDIESRLIYKLEKIKEVKDIFHSDIVDYEDGLLELDKTKRAFNDALRKAGNAVIMWTRAHFQLSKGVTEPAEIDIMHLMLGAASKVVPGL